MGEARTDRLSPDLDRLTVAQAADALNINQDAVRKRIARGTIPYDRDEAGRVYVYLSASEPKDPAQQVHRPGTLDGDEGFELVADAFGSRDEILEIRAEGVELSKAPLSWGMG